MTDPAPSASLVAAIAEALVDKGWKRAADLHPSAVESIAELAAGVAEPLLREQIAAELRRAAEGRREYASSAPVQSLGRAALEEEAVSLERAARIAEGDSNTLAAVLPSWRWDDRLRAEVLRVASRLT